MGLVEGVSPTSLSCIYLTYFMHQKHNQFSTSATGVTKSAGTSLESDYGLDGPVTVELL